MGLENFLHLQAAYQCGLKDYDLNFFIIELKSNGLLSLQHVSVITSPVNFRYRISINFIVKKIFLLLSFYSHYY